MRDPFRLGGGGLGRRSYDERLRLIAARAPPGGQEKKSGDYNTAIRKDITMAAVKCRCVADGNAPDHGLFGKNRRRVQNASGGIDKSGDAGVGGSGKRDVIFHRAQDDHAEMLVRCCRIAEPGVVGNRDHEIGAVSHEFAHEIRKDHFEADDDTEAGRYAGNGPRGIVRLRRKRQDCRDSPGFKVPDSLDKFVQKK